MRRAPVQITFFILKTATGVGCWCVHINTITPPSKITLLCFDFFVFIYCFLSKSHMSAFPNNATIVHLCNMSLQIEHILLPCVPLPLPLPHFPLHLSLTTPQSHPYVPTPMPPSPCYLLPHANQPTHSPLTPTRLPYHPLSLTAYLSP